MSPASRQPSGDSPVFSRLMSGDTFSSSGQVAILATALITLLTTMTTLIYQFVREGRRHRWEEEAARRHAEVAAKSEKDRLEIAQRVRMAETNLNAKLDENTEISRQAFTEANHMNAKLAEQSANFDKLLAVALTASEKRSSAAANLRGITSDLAAAKDLKQVKETVDTTAGQVSDIHHSVVKDG